MEKSMLRNPTASAIIMRYWMLNLEEHHSVPQSTFSNPPTPPPTHPFCTLLRDCRSGPSLPSCWSTTFNATLPKSGSALRVSAMQQFVPAAPRRHRRRHTALQFRRSTTFELEISLQGCSTRSARPCPLLLVPGVSLSPSPFLYWWKLHIHWTSLWPPCALSSFFDEIKTGRWKMVCCMHIIKPIHILNKPWHLNGF